MKKNSFGVYFLMITLLMLGGCGGGSSSSITPAPTSSAEQAALASDAIVATIAGVYSQTIEEEAALKSVSVISASTVGVIKADGITSASSCVAGSVPSFTDESSVISSEITGSSGSCVTMREMGDDESIFKLSCEGYDSGNGVLLDGVIWAVGDSYGGMTVTSDGLTTTTDGNECPLILNMTISGSGNTATASGCVSECGSAFTIANRTQEVEGYCAGSAASAFESMFSGSCTYPGEGEPAEGATFSYTDIEAYMLANDKSAEDQLCLFMAMCHIEGVNDCITMDQLNSAGEFCGSESGGDESGGGDICNDELAPSEGDPSNCAQYDNESECNSHYEYTDHEGETGNRNCVWTEHEGEDICGSYMTLCEMEE